MSILERNDDTNSVNFDIPEDYHRNCTSLCLSYFPV